MNSGNNEGNKSKLEQNNVLRTDFEGELLANILKIISKYIKIER